MDNNNMTRHSLPDFNQFFDPHCLPLFNNYGPNARAPAPSSEVQHNGPKTNTQEPMVTGTSVLGIRYKDGVMLAADTLLSYGSMARFRDVSRISTAGKFTIIGASGEYSDYQYLLRLIDELILGDELNEDGNSLYPHSIHSWLTRVLYQRRNKFDPLWGKYLVAGFRDGRGFLGLSDLKGTSYTDNTIATGYGAYIALPLMRSAYREDMTKDEAQKLLEDCLRVLYYRDARSSPRIQIATIDATGPTISAPYELATNWDVGFIKYGPQIKQTNFIIDENNKIIQ